MTVSYEKSVHLILSQIADSSASLMRGASVSSSDGLKGRVLASTCNNILPYVVPRPFEFAAVQKMKDESGSWEKVLVNFKSRSGSCY